MKHLIKLISLGLFVLVFLPLLVSARSFLSPYDCAWETKLFLKSGKAINFDQLLQEQQQQGRIIQVCDTKKCLANGYVGECPPCPYYRNQTVTEELTKEQKEAIIRAKLSEMNLSEDDINIITGFIINGYTVQEQTLDEYNEFLYYAEQINKNPKSCYVFKAIAHKGRWTGAIGEFNKNVDTSIVTCPKVSGSSFIEKKCNLE